MSSVGSLTNLKGSELNQLRESRAQQPNDNSQSTRYAIYFLCKWSRFSQINKKPPPFHKS